MIQLMKNRFSPGHKSSDYFENISVFVGTFNMGEVPPPRELGSWFSCQGEGATLPANSKFDMYVVGSQESGLPEKEWIAIIRFVSSKTKSFARMEIPTHCFFHHRRHIGEQYHLVATVSLWQIRIVMFVKPELKTKISHVQTSSVATVCCLHRLFYYSNANIFFFFVGHCKRPGKQGRRGDLSLPWEHLAVLCQCSLCCWC